MIRLIITANDELYDRLSTRARAEGEFPQRAVNVLDGFNQAMELEAGSAGGPTSARAVSAIIVDMSLHAADTLVETLHSRRITSHIPLLAVNCDKRQLPLALRRLCTDVLEADTLRPLDAL
jgi:hypothetical protein